MRVVLRRLFSVSNLSIHRSAVRFTSSDKKNPEKSKSEPDKDPERNLVVEKYGAVTTMSIDRMTYRNSLDIETLKAMTAVIEDFDKDDDAHVLIFHGEGGTFSSGYDLDDMIEKGYSTMMDAAARFRRRPLCDKITIAAVSGYAVAEGFELALACDLRVIEDTAVLGCFGRRFGLYIATAYAYQKVDDPVGVPFQSMYGGRKLTALIGLSRALDLVMTGRPITGVEANQFGLAAKLTTTGTALGEAIKLAKSLTKFPQNALTMDKLSCINSQLNPNSEESMRDDAVMTSLLGDAIIDISEGVQRFKKGIGKHGKFHKLKEVPAKDWEIESTSTEIEIVRGEVVCKTETKE